MKKNLVVLFLFYPFFLYSQTPMVEWQKSIGGSFQDSAEKITPTNDGGYAITGFSKSSNFDVPSNAGAFDIYVIKIDKSGNIQWKTSIGGAGDDYSYGIVETQDGYYVAGNTIGGYNFVPLYGHNDVVLIKLNLNGLLLWKKHFGGSENDYCRDLIKTNDGNLIMAGQTESSDYDITTNHGSLDAWVVKFDLDGNIIWQKNFGGNNRDYLYSIHQTTDNGYVLSGASESNLVGNYGLNDAYILKINSVGDIEWQNHFGGSNNDKFLSVIQLRDGSYIAVGDSYSNNFDAIGNHSTNGTRDGFVVKITTTGTKEWSKCFGGSSEDDTRCVIQTIDNRYLILAQTHSFDGNITSMNGEADFWLLKLNLDGSIKWQKTYGGTGHETPKNFLQTAANDCILVGDSYSNDSGDVTGNHGDDDVWVVKLINEETCFSSIILDKNITNETANFHAESTLTSKVKITNSVINYKAGTHILLTNGFEVKAGNVFKAIIEGCNN